MKQFFEKNKAKKIILLCAGAAAVIAACVLLIVFLGKSNAPKTVVNQVDTHYSELAKKESISKTDVEKALKDYAKLEEPESVTYTKGNESVVVKYDAQGNVTYLCYKNNLSSEEQVQLHDFNESMIQIGDKKEDVLDLLKQDQYIYQLKSLNDKAQKLEIYYYGWTSKEAILELVFTDDVLTYYTINSQSIAAKSNAPDIEDFH